MGRACSIEEGRSVFKILTGKPTGKRPLGRLRSIWEDSIKTIVLPVVLYGCET